ncbi:MAG: amino acid adenylation domain-containing protein, partial [bacterium]|nr:amino acid adenylation domain-containing protein [bacterium]
IKIRENEHLLMVDMPHIVSDATSIGVLIKDFMLLVAGEHLAPINIHYKDYSEWQNQTKEKERVKKQETYWLKQFEGEIPVLNLPTDYPRPAIRTFEGKKLFFRLDEGETVALKSIALAHGATLYMVLLTLFNSFLSKLSGQEDVIIGTPTAGRGHADLGDIIGMFVNTLGLRNQPQRDKTYEEFLEHVKETTLNAFDNQDYQFEELVETLTINRDASRNPLFDVMFLLQNMELTKIEIPGLKLKPFDYEIKTAKFDLTLQGTESGEQMEFGLTYTTKLFKEETIRRFITYFKRIVSRVLEEPGAKLAEIDILAPEEKQRVLYDFNDTAAQYPAAKTLHRLFAEQVERTPANIAIKPQALTYLQLDEAAARLARHLQARGVGENDLVAILVDRSIEMITGILAILKAGGAYLPIHPHQPGERITFILDDSSVNLLLTTTSAAENITFREEILYLDEMEQKTTEEAHPTPIREAPPLTTGGTATPARLAYIIYTSGSTGTPKGVMVEHRAVVNILTALQKRYPLLETDTYLFKTSYVFDVSVTEIFGWYMGGGQLALLEKEGEKDPSKILETVAEMRVTHINFVPAMFNVFTGALNETNIHKLATLKYIFLAGEALSSQLVTKFRQLNDDIILENIYGPTEATIYAAGYSLSQWNRADRIPIGTPMPNLRLYILDKDKNIQPIGVPGELCIAGVGLARGYLNRPELTAEKFEKATPSFPANGDPITDTTIYRTGDLCRWQPDGKVEYMGRMDYQVKIRGYRIELGEIESMLLKHHEIKEAVVMDREDDNNEKFLCAYYVTEHTPGPETKESEKFQQSALRDYMSGKLPDYMLPAYFVELEKLPLTPSGKIHRQALPSSG